MNFGGKILKLKKNAINNPQQSTIKEIFSHLGR